MTSWANRRQRPRMRHLQHFAFLQPSKQVSRFQPGCRREWWGFNFPLQPNERFIFRGQQSNCMSNMTCRQGISTDSDVSRCRSDVGSFFLADPAEPEFISTVCAAFGRGVIGGQGCKLSGRELPRFENSRNVEMRALSHLLMASLSADNFDPGHFHVFAIAKT